MKHALTCGVCIYLCLLVVMVTEECAYHVIYCPGPDVVTPMYQWCSTLGSTDKVDKKRIREETSTNCRQLADATAVVGGLYLA